MSRARLIALAEAAQEAGCAEVLVPVPDLLSLRPKAKVQHSPVDMLRVLFKIALRLDRTCTALDVLVHEGSVEVRAHEMLSVSYSTADATSPWAIDLQSLKAALKVKGLVELGVDCLLIGGKRVPLIRSGEQGIPRIECSAPAELDKIGERVRGAKDLLAFTAEDDGRDYTHGVLVGRDVQVATDGHRLGLIGDIKGTGRMWPRELIETLSDLAIDACEVQSSGDVLVFRAGRLVVRALLPDVSFPTWSQVIPQTSSRSGTFPDVDLKPYSDLKIEGSRLLGRIDTEFVEICEVEGIEDGRIGIERRYVEDAIKFAGRSFRFSGEQLDPLVFGTPERLCVVMPKRL